MAIETAESVLKLVDYLTITALVLGPVIAVGITLWYQESSEKRKTKERLFIQLMGNRKSLKPEWVNALNLVDVIYADHPKVLEKWARFYDFVNIKPLDQKQYERHIVDLLSEIGESLGYKNLKQMDIDKVYSPEAHGLEAELLLKTRLELLRVLQNSESFSTVKREPEPKAVN